MQTWHLCCALLGTKLNSGNLISHCFEANNFPLLPCDTKSAWFFICCSYVLRWEHALRLQVQQHLYRS